MIENYFKSVSHVVSQKYRQEVCSWVLTVKELFGDKFLFIITRLSYVYIACLLD